MIEAVEAVVDSQVAVAKLRLHMLCAAVGLVILAAAAYAVWNHGYDFADAKWVKTHNKQVKALNDKIAKIESTSKTEADNLRKDVAVLEAKLAKVTSAAPIIIAHDAKGDVLKCDGKEVVPYLGSDFSKVWNQLNEEGAMK